jgi:hypothetical protein
MEQEEVVDSQSHPGNLRTTRIHNDFMLEFRGIVFCARRLIEQKCPLKLYNATLPQ